MARVYIIFTSSTGNREVAACPYILCNEKTNEVNDCCDSDLKSDNYLLFLKLYGSEKERSQGTNEVTDDRTNEFFQCCAQFILCSLFGKQAQNFDKLIVRFLLMLKINKCIHNYMNKRMSARTIKGTNGVFFIKYSAGGFRLCSVRKI